MKFKRQGDVNLFPITQEEYDKAQGKILKHEGSYILARGEATGSVHQISVKDKKEMEIKEAMGKIYIAIKNEEATVIHTHDHETITVPSKTFYVQIPEREIDHFANSTVRKVVD